MSAIFTRIPIAVKLTVAIMTPLLITAAAFYFYGSQVQNAQQIYPNIFIAGVDVSGMTRDEAMLPLGLPAYVERSTNAHVTVTFPNESVLTVTGNDVNLYHNARDVVSEAFFIGRENGVIQNTISYLQRFNADEITFNIDYVLDSSALMEIVTDFVEEYNRILDASGPVIYEDRIVFTKGAGTVNADINGIFNLVYAGLFQSVEEKTPVDIIYSLPETNEIALEIINMRNKVLVEVISSEYSLESNSATESVIGIDFDAIEAARVLKDTETGKTAEFPFIFTHPEYSQEYLESLLFRDLIGQRTTYAQGTSNRLNNINLSSQEINGLVILSGEEFSYNETVGQRTYERGFREAPAFARGETVMAIGGGICQTSSTIYAAIKPTELLVTERRPHGQPITYLPPGWDATVVWNYIDFKFVNNTAYPLRIDIELEGRNLTAKIYGTIIDDFPRKAGWND